LGFVITRHRHISGERSGKYATGESLFRLALVSFVRCNLLGYNV